MPSCGTGRCPHISSPTLLAYVGCGQRAPRTGRVEEYFRRFARTHQAAHRKLPAPRSERAVRDRPVGESAARSAAPRHAPVGCSRCDRAPTHPGELFREIIEEHQPGYATGNGAEPGSQGVYRHPQRRPGRHRRGRATFARRGLGHATARLENAAGHVNCEG